jgi:hypothetical protein
VAVAVGVGVKVEVGVGGTRVSVDVGNGDDVGVAVVCIVGLSVRVLRQAVKPNANSSAPVILRNFLRVNLFLSAMSIL